MKQFLFLLLVLYSLGGLAHAVTSNELARRTLVIYNRNDLDAPGLARFYAQQRHLPNDHIVGLDCSTDEEISRQEYDEKIAAPLRKIFTERKWWTLRNEPDQEPRVDSNQIDFVALIRGIPLKIRATSNYPGDHPENNQIGSQNQSSVDSELCLLGRFTHQISGPASNPYFQVFRPITEMDSSPLMLVCRLDAPAPETVRRMITDAIQAETDGLWGRAYVDGAGKTSTGLADGDEWMRDIVKALRRSGIPTIYDLAPEIFPSGFPMNDCILYYGWYADKMAGPFQDPGFTFAPGAIAVHIHSFSASTLRSADANWVGPLLSKGAAASLGNVYEPYLQLTPHLDIFNDRLLHGFTFAESAYMATRALSWMNVAVGDPLYRPYASWLQLEATQKDGQTNDWQMYHGFALKNAERSADDYFNRACQAAIRARNAPMLEDLGLERKEAGDFGNAITCLQQARSLYKKRDDLMRAALEQVDALVKAGQKKRALSVVRTVLEVIPDAPASVLFRRLEEQLNGTPASRSSARPSP